MSPGGGVAGGRQPAWRAAGWLLCGLLLTSCSSTGSAALVLDSRSFASDVAFLPGGEVGCALLEAGEHRLVSFDRASGRRRRQLRLADGEDDLSQLAISPSGRWLAAGLRQLHTLAGQVARGGGSEPVRAGGAIVLVELASLRVVRRVPVVRPVLSLLFLDEQRLAVGTAAVQGSDRRALPETAGVCLLDLTGSWIGCSTLHGDAVTGLAAWGGQLISGSWDGSVRFWSPSLQPRGQLQIGAPVNALGVAPGWPGGPLLAVAISREPPRRSRALLELERKGGHQARIHSGDRVELWALADRRRRRVIRRHRSYPTKLALSRDGGLLASGGWDWTVRVEPGSFRSRLPRFSQIITGLALSPEGDALAVAAWTEQGSGAPSCTLLPLAPRSSVEKNRESH